MKDRNVNQTPDDLRLDENDPVWRLLAESPRAEPDGWFAVRTIARCRNMELGTDWVAFRGVLRWALGGGLGVCLAVLLLVPHARHTGTTTAPVSDQNKNVQEAFEIMASMNTPTDSSSSATLSTWQDSSL